MSTSSDDVDTEAAKLSQKNIELIGISNGNLKREDPAKNLLTREAAINGYTQIEKIHPLPGQEFCVVAYFLSNEIGPDGCHGMWYFIGTFSSAKKANKRAVNIIEKSGIKTVYATKTCTWQEINDKFTPDRIKMVPTDKRGKLRQQHEKEYQGLVENFERDREIREEIEEELTREFDEDSLEYYIQQWFQIIKNTALVEKLESDLKQAKKHQVKCIQNLKAAHAKNPEHENNWIPRLEDRLPKRGEDDLLNALKKGSDLMRPDILGDQISELNKETPQG